MQVFMLLSAAQLCASLQGVRVGEASPPGPAVRTSPTAAGQDVDGPQQAEPPRVAS